MDTENNNVVNLPSFINESRAYNALACLEMVRGNKEEFCDEVTDFTMDTVISTLHNFGFFMDTGRFEPNDAKLIEEAINSLVYRYYNIPHPLHNVVETIFDVDGEESEES